MRRNKLLNLIDQNRGRGYFKAESTDTGNVMYVYDVILASDSDADWWGGVSAESFVKALAAMTGDVDIRINSPGGDVFGAQAMYNAVKAYDRGTITAYIDGFAASAASTLAIAADKTILSGEGAMVMIHKAWTIQIGNADDFRAEADLLDKIDANLARQYAAKSGKSEADILAMLDKGDTWLSAQETVDLGLADEIASGKVSNTSAPKWDLSAYGKGERAPGNSLTLKLDATEFRQMLDDALADINNTAANDDDADARDRRVRETEMRLRGL